MDYKKTAAGILESVGGEANVQALTHCATRLRFVLKDQDKADATKVRAVPGVITTAAGGGLSIKSLGEGNYTVTFSKIGYATQTLNVSITGDALNTIDVTLVKLNS